MRCCQADDVQWYQMISYRLDQHGTTDVAELQDLQALRITWGSYRFVSYVSYNNYQLLKSDMDAVSQPNTSIFRDAIFRSPAQCTHCTRNSVTCR